MEMLECEYWTDCIGELLDQMVCLGEISEEERNHYAEDNSLYSELIKRLKSERCSKCALSELP